MAAGHVHEALTFFTGVTLYTSFRLLALAQQRATGHVRNTGSARPRCPEAQRLHHDLCGYKERTIQRASPQCPRHCVSRSSPTVKSAEEAS